MTKLSGKQHTILNMMCSGFSTKDIANEIGVSVGAVLGYRKIIRDKMGAKSSVELGRLAVEHGLVPLRKVEA